MENSVARQTPLTALATLVLTVAAAYIRFALHPYPNECIAAGTAPLAQWLAVFAAEHRTWAALLAIPFTVAAGIVTAQICTRFGLYYNHCLLSMPLFGVAACGIFIGADPLSPAVAALLTAAAIYCLGSGYLRDESLEMMLYAGLCMGLLPMLFAPGLLLTLMAVAAIFIFSLSAREIFVLLCSMCLIPFAVCYVTWAFGGDFTAPVQSLWQAFAGNSHSQAFGCDAVAALTLAGLAGFDIVCSAAIFFDDRYAMAVKPRGILFFIITVSLAAAAMFVLPSASTAVFAPAAVPLSMLMPLLFLRIRQGWAMALYCSTFAVVLLHFVVA